jgi:hypothetical protein
MRVLVFVLMVNLIHANLWAKEESLAPMLRITKKVMQEKTFFKFEYCEKKSCRTLGPKKFYSRRALKSRKMKEYWLTAFTGIVDVALIMSAFFSGAAIGGVCNKYLAKEGQNGVAFSVGGLVGITGAVHLIHLKKFLNSIKHFEAAGELSDIEEREITEDAEKIVENLEWVLEKI